MSSTFDVEPDVVDMDILIPWLQFAHLGRLSLTTPSWWLLRWAGCDLAVADHWDGKYLHEWVYMYAEDQSGFSERVRHMVPNAGVGETIFTWLDNAVAEILPNRDWYMNGGRDDAMTAICKKLCTVVANDHQTAKPQPVTLRDVLKMERDMGTRMPADFRCLMLEVGDCGWGLFRWPFMCDVGRRLYPGEWKWSARHQFHPDAVDNAFAGSFLLGPGAGYIRSELVLVSRGKRRGEVWVVDQEREDEDEWTLIPFQESMLKRDTSPASDFVQFVMIWTGIEEL